MSISWKEFGKVHIITILVGFYFSILVGVALGNPSLSSAERNGRPLPAPPADHAGTHSYGQLYKPVIIRYHCLRESSQETHGFKHEKHGGFRGFPENVPLHQSNEVRSQNTLWKDTLW